MFDEYVEHTSAPNALSSTGLSLPHVQYEGFEPSPYPEEEDAFSGSRPETVASAPSVPLFALEKVQYSPPAPLAAVVVASDTLIMGLISNTIVIIELSREEQVVQIPIPRKPTEFTIYKLFLDPSGRHLLISSTQGENWYLYKGWKKPRVLKSYKMVIESVAWNKAALLSSSRSTSTREMIIGARNGILYEAVLDAEEDFFKSQERFLQPVFTLPERHPVTGVKFDFYPPTDPRRVLVVVTTPSRIYQFVGSIERRSDDGSKTFSSVFAAYRDTAPKILELPGNVDYSELHVFSPNADQAYSLPKSIAWMTAPGIYHGTLNFESGSDDMIDGAQLLPYPALPESSTPPPTAAESSPPVSMALTEFHFVLLYGDRAVGISCLNEELVYEEILPLKANEAVRGITADPIRKTYWVYTDQSLFELSIRNEDRDVWKIFLAQGKYDVALQYAKAAGQRDLVIAAQARAYFTEGRYFQAAQSYAQCSATFEEVTLRFLDVGQRDALRSYLISRLERTKRTDLSQRVMLATWLVEFYLNKCNELDDLVASESVSQDVINLHAERAIVEEDLKQFFSTYKSVLEPKTIYELIEGHGRIDMYLHFASVIEDFERVVEHYIMEEDWNKAIETLNSQRSLELYYRFASVLIYQSAKEMVDSWLRQPALDPLRLVPALLRLQHTPRDPLSPNQAIRYLNYVIYEQRNTSPVIHNLIITFYTSTNLSEDDGPLLRFLTTAPSDPITDRPYYDLDYALRLCKHAGRVQPCVHICAKMGLWESSVDLALSKGDLDLAKINADMPPEEDRQLRKRLWLKIARYVVQEKQDIKTAMQFLDNTNLLKVEDILPFFPDFVVIDDFKEEICTALEGYSAHIDALKADMDETTRNAEAIKQDIAALQKRFITLDVQEKCVVCELALLTRQFYVFPCHHTFHADCLIGLTKEYLPSSALRKIIALQSELVKNSQQRPIDRNAITNQATPLRQQAVQRSLLSANFGIPTTVQNSAKAANSFGRNILSAGDRLRDLIVPDALASVVTAPAGWIPGIGGGAGRKVGDKDAGKRAEKLRRELEDLLAGTCPLCESVVAGVDKPFVKEGEEDTSWML